MDETLRNWQDIIAETDGAARGAWDTLLTLVEERAIRLDCLSETIPFLLHHAATSCTATTVRRLLDAGAAPSVADDRGNTPMHLAATSRKDTLQKCQLLPVATRRCI
jgi:ankyrin repeat protein